MQQSIAVALLVWLVAVSSSSAAHYQVLFLGGQSNASGRADAAQLGPPLSQPQTDVRLYHRNLQDSNSVLPEDQWINLAPGSGHGSSRFFLTEFGPEVSFGRAMADAKTAEKIAIIKYAYGGSNLHSDWAAGGRRYTAFIKTVQDGLAALTAEGHIYTLRGMLWQQGEADASEPAASSYEVNLTSLIARVRADLNGGVAFPFVIGSLSSSQYKSITTVGSAPHKVRTAQQNVADTVPLAAIGITDGFGILTDGIHFNHNGQVALGEMFASQILALEGFGTTLIHHWALDGNANDTGSTGGHHGSTVGNASYTSGSGGKFGAAVSLDGGGAYIQVNRSSLPASDFTLTAWIYRKTAASSMYVAGTQVSANSGAFLRGEAAGGSTTANNALFANLLPAVNSTTFRRAWGGTIPLNQWTHVAMTVNSTEGLALFINGTSVGTNASATSHTAAGNFRIGARPDSNANHFDGLIDDVAIFEGVLTGAQLANVIAHGAPNFNGVVVNNDPPEVLTLTPGDGDLTVATDADLVIRFNKAVRKGLSGDIVIRSDDGTVFETIPVTDARVSISEAAVTIARSGTFAFDRGYHVQIAAGAFTDVSGNAWTGIDGTDVTTWNFSTVLAQVNVGSTGVFDENTNATNLLDREFPAATLGAFKTSVLSAYSRNLGGVIDWETGVNSVASVTTDPKNFLSSVAASYGASGGKNLILTFDRKMALYTNAVVGQVEALSRQGTKHNVLIPDGGNLAIGLSYGIAFSGANVVELGMAIPSRSTYGALGVDFLATATHSGGGFEEIAFTVGGVIATGDTFLNFKAPEGQFIADVSVAYVDDNGQNLANGQRRPVLDDLGFVVAPSRSNTFANWMGGFIVGSQTDLGDDPDGDGIANAIENYFGTRPDAFTSGLVAVAMNGNTLTFTHPLNASPAEDLVLNYRWSTDLGIFHDDGAPNGEGTTTVTFSDPTPTGGGLVSVTASITGAVIPEKLFVKVMVTKP